MADRSRQRLTWWRPTLLVALLGVGAVLAWRTELPTADRLKQVVDEAGVLGPVAFVTVYAAATLAPLPKNVLSAVAGAVFGLPVGVALVYVAALLGAGAAFWLGRVLGQPTVERLTGARVARLDALLARRGLVAVLGARLVPVVPFTALNYGAGLTSVRGRDYLLGTALGIVPGTVAYVAVGSFAGTPGSWPFVVAVASLLLLSLGAVTLALRRRAAGQSAGRAAAGPPT
ncbi:MAG: TVP38/TMEM64 family protein [Nocardioidaceae bacterium]